jgi:5-methylcytosine-specific restriction endonuclease McrA
MGDFWDDEPKRTLGIREKQILYRNAKGRCQNPACRKKLDFTEMQVGHKTAASKGGRATLKNCVCLCWRCNKLQHTDSWKTFLKKQGIQDNSDNTKRALKTLSIPKLKILAKKNS